MHVETLKVLNEQFILNFINRDAVAHDKIIHERFVCYMPNGARLDRAAYLSHWAGAFDPNVMIYFDYRDESIDVFDNIGLVRSATKYTRVSDGTAQSGMNFYTDTYLRENGTWKCIQAHLTPVAPEHWPDDDSIVRAWVDGHPA